jgi:hemerythrin-like metal-binding protein
MAPIQWKPEYSVGIEGVDHEHRQLIELVNRIGETLASQRPAAEIEEEFAELHRAISAHFALEERFMRERGYDQLAQHKADHERLLDDLREIMDGCGEGRAVSPAPLTEAVEAWFAVHFQTHDARLHSRLGAHVP